MHDSCLLLSCIHKVFSISARTYASMTYTVTEQEQGARHSGAPLQQDAKYNTVRVVRAMFCYVLTVSSVQKYA